MVIAMLPRRPAGVPVRAVTPTGLTSRLLQCQAVLPDNVQCGGVVEKGRLVFVSPGLLPSSVVGQ